MQRYYYSRFNGGFQYDKLRKKDDPIVRGVSKAKYTARSIEDCILQHDLECQLINGHKEDLTIVGERHF